MKPSALFRIMIAAGLILGLTISGHASLPRLISFQGQLTDEFKEPLPDDVFQMTFRIYADAAGGVPLWEETQNVALG